MAARFWLGGILLAAGPILLAGCGSDSPGAVDPAKLKVPPPEVTVAKPVSRQVTDYFEFPGQTSAVEEVEVRARVAGYLVKIAFRDGQEVKKDDLLFEIDPRPYKAELDRAAAELERLKALLKKAKTNLTRGQRLRPSGAISQDEFEQHESNLEVHQASIQAEEAAIREAKLNLEFTRVLSPIDGQVSRRRITEGNLVQAGPVDATALTTVVALDKIYVCFNIEEPTLLQFRDLDWRVGQNGRPRHIKDIKVPIEVGIPNEEGFPHRGEIDFLDNKVDRGTGTICARGIFDNANRKLTPGLFVRVRVPFGKQHPVLLVPERAIARDQKLKFLWVVDKDNVARRRDIQVGSLQKDMRVVASGLQPDDLVIVNGLQRVRKSGDAVAPHFGDKAGPAAAQEATTGAAGTLAAKAK
jgi:RND family efflux transporter MFP subunit